VQGTQKALCARCLQRGEHHEETVTHEVNDCPEARKVWAGIAKAWEAATGEPLDTTTPRLTAFAQNLGPPRRSKPATGTRPPSQPGACCTPSPCDSSIRHAPGCTWRTTPRAAHTRPSGPRPGTSSAPSASASQARYMTRPSTPCEASPSPRQGRELPRPQGRLRDSQPQQGRATPQPAQRRTSHPARCTRLHAHTRHSSPPPCQSRAAAEGRWALAVEDITADGSRTTRMRASGAIATAATHGARHSECVAARRQEGMPGGRQEGAPQRRPATQAPSPLDPHGAPPETSCRREKARRGGERRTGASRVTTFGCWRG
jgi:hypothetical protein